MPLVSFNELMRDAEAGGYAVGYFESWNFESLLAVADAAAAVRSPVILGFSGITLPNPDRAVKDPMSAYAALGLDVCRTSPVPTCFLFNESPYLDAVMRAIDLGFNLVMFSDEAMNVEQQTEQVKKVCARTRGTGIAVEAEMESVPGVAGHLHDTPADLHLTDPHAARDFVRKTGIDALSVNIGQMHLHGRSKVRLKLDRLKALRESIAMPLVLHGASSIEEEDLAAARRGGIRKINVGSVLKQCDLATMREACNAVAPNANPYEVVGSGLGHDILVASRVAVQKEVERLMRLFGSADRAS